MMRNGRPIEVRIALPASALWAMLILALAVNVLILTVAPTWAILPAAAISVGVGQLANRRTKR